MFEILGHKSNQFFTYLNIYEYYKEWCEEIDALVGSGVSDEEISLKNLVGLKGVG